MINRRIPEIYNQYKINDFFLVLSNIFVFRIEKGAVNISDIQFELDNNHVSSVIISGLCHIENALDTSLIRIFIETYNSSIIAKYPDIDLDTLLQLKLLEVVIPYIQMNEIEKFIILASQLCHGSTKGDIENLMSGYMIFDGV